MKDLNTDKVDFRFAVATLMDAGTIASLVLKLIEEISQRSSAEPFDIDVVSTEQRCEKLLVEGHYAAILANIDNKAVAVATMAETYALYAGGKIGVIQEFYVLPEHRSTGLGARLLEQVRHYARQQNWSCIELCTPPLPEFERTLGFYQQNGLLAVGGRKMRQHLNAN